MLNANQISRFLPANSPANLLAQIETFLELPGATTQMLHAILNQAGIPDSAQVAIDMWAADQALRPRPAANQPEPPDPPEPRPVHPNPGMVYVGATLPDIGLVVDTRGLPRVVNDNEDARLVQRQPPRRPAPPIPDDEIEILVPWYRKVPWMWFLVAIIIALLVLLIGMATSSKDSASAPAAPTAVTTTTTPAPAAIGTTPVPTVMSPTATPAPAESDKDVMSPTDTTSADPSDLEERLTANEAVDRDQDEALVGLKPTKTFAQAGYQTLADAFQECKKLPVADQAWCRTQARNAANLAQN